MSLGIALMATVMAPPAFAQDQQQQQQQTQNQQQDKHPKG
jgi:hypothetical protein